MFNIVLASQNGYANKWDNFKTSGH